MEISFSLILEKSMPAFSVAWQLIRIFRSPNLYQVLSSFALIILVTTYSTVARSLISFSARISCFSSGVDLRQAATRQVHNRKKENHLTIVAIYNARPQVAAIF